MGKVVEGTAEELPCGCKIWLEETPIGNAFMVAGCEAGLECKNVQFIQRESLKDGKPFVKMGDALDEEVPN